MFCCFSGFFLSSTGEHIITYKLKRTRFQTTDIKLIKISGKINVMRFTF